MDNVLKQLGEMADGFTATAYTAAHYSFMLLGRPLHYRPQAQRWTWKSRTYNGTLANLRGFAYNRRLEVPRAL